MVDDIRRTYEALLIAAVGLVPVDSPPEQALEALVSGLNQVDPVAFLSLAEGHGLGALLYHLVRPLKAELKPELRLALQGVYLRRRDLAEAQNTVLRRILRPAAEAGLDVLLLKGAALGHLVYDHPHLRPMSDLDLLIPLSQLEPAKEVLSGIGMDVFPLEHGLGGLHRERHLPELQCEVNGLKVVVELHHSLSRPQVPGSRVPDRRPDRALNFELSPGGVPARTLPPEWMLWHLCHHLCDHAVFKVPLIWLLDIVLTARRYYRRIDWTKTAEESPLVVNTLELLDRSWPLPDELRHLLGFSDGPPMTPDLRDCSPPWKEVVRRLGAFRSYKELFFPSDWWLRLYHGLGPNRSAWPHRCLIHPLHMTGRIGRRLLQGALES